MKERPQAPKTRDEKPSAHYLIYTLNRQQREAQPISQQNQKGTDATTQQRLAELFGRTKPPRSIREQMRYTEPPEETFDELMEHPNYQPTEHVLAIFKPKP